MSIHVDLLRMGEKETDWFNQIANKVQFSYTKLIDAMSRANRADLFWWITPLASRNTYLSPAFKNICTALLGKTMIDREPDISTISVGTWCVKEVLEQYAISLKKNIQIKCYEPGPVHWSDQKKQYVDQLKHYYSDSLLFKEAYQGPSLDKKDLFFVDTFILPSDFHADGYQEHYFPDLFQYVKDTAKSVYMVPLTYRNTNAPLTKVIDQIKEIPNYQCIFKESYLTKWDFIQMAGYPYQCHHFLMKELFFYGLNISPILNDDIIRGISNENSMHGLANYFFIKHLHQKNVSIRGILHWYEGQPSTMGMSMAFRKYYKNAVNYGYNSTAFFPYLLSMDPSIEQNAQKVTPAILTVTGKGYLQEAKKFCPNLKVTVMPSLRSQWIYHFPFDEKPAETLHVLVALPYFKDSCIKILKGIEDFVKEHRNLNVYFTVKNHPYHKGQDLHYYKIHQPIHNLKFEEKPLSELLIAKDLVITTKSAIGLEILSVGKPVIFWRTLGELDDFGIPKTIKKQMFQIISGRSELSSAILFFKKQLEDNFPFRKEGEKIRCQYLEQAMPENINKIFQEQGVSL